MERNTPRAGDEANLDGAVSAPERNGPVKVQDRVASVDILRGFALLGILMINIVFFGLPGLPMNNPSVGGFTGINRAAWIFNYLFFYNKFMPIFSMLFGAGLVLMSERAEKSGRSIRRFYYVRIAWLLVFGLLHAYLLWYGDILYSYAICGLLIYPLRRFSSRTLLVVGIAVLLIGIPMQMSSGHYFQFMKDQAEEAESLRADGDTLTAREERVIEGWEGIRSVFAPTPEEIESEIEKHQGGYAEIFKNRLPVSLMMQTAALIFFTLWRAGGLMIIGMGLMKAGVFSATRSRAFYITLAAAGYAIGIPIVCLGIKRLITHDFYFIYNFKEDSNFNYVGSIGIALAHIGVVMLICKSGVPSAAKKRLAAVGRMAFSNYISHSLICTTIFYGYGLSLFGRLGHAALLPVVLGIWILQLIVSPIWLDHFRFGPLEWLWRSLTYGKRQPMRLT